MEPLGWGSPQRKWVTKDVLWTLSLPLLSPPSFPPSFPLPLFLSHSSVKLNVITPFCLWCSTSRLRNNKTKWPTLKLVKTRAKVSLSSLKSTPSGVWSQQWQVTEREGKKETCPLSHGRGYPWAGGGSRVNRILYKGSNGMAQDQAEEQSKQPCQTPWACRLVWQKPLGPFHSAETHPQWRSQVVHSHHEE